MYNETKLPNGIKLITAPIEGTKTATILVMVGTGSKYENRKNNGISHFLEHMFFKGTKKRQNTLAISAELDGMGAEYNAFTGKEYTGYWVKTEAGKIETAVDIVSDMLLNSKFEQKEIDREKGVILEELNMYLDNPMMYIEDVFEQCLYGDTPAGWDTIGTRKNILNFQRRDFVDYLQAQYTKNNISICLVGKVDKRMESIIEKYFVRSELNKRGRNFSEKAKVQIAQSKPASIISYKATDQVHMSLGVRTYGYSHKDAVILKLISLILGGSMSSRLFINLRERHGLAYYVRTMSELYTDTGYLTTQAGVPVKKAEQAIKIILGEYRKLKTTQLSQQELKRTKDLLKGRLAIQMEASDNMANWYARQAVMLGTIARTEKRAKTKLTSPGQYLSQINKITPSDIKRVARDIFASDKLNLALIGPFKNGAKFNKLLKL